MEVTDPKKLIAGFLLLATVVTSSALLFAIGISKNTLSQRTAEEITLNGNDPTVPRDAFVETVPSAPESTQSTVTKTSAAKLTLTDQLVLALGQRLDEANANGIAVVNGAANLARPDPDKIVSDILESGNWDAVKIPDWEKEINAQHITVLTEYTTGDMEAYNKEIGVLMEQYLAPAPSQSVLDTSGGLAGIPFDKARTAGIKVVVPEPLAGFHWSLMKMLAYQDRVLALTKLAETDPVRAALVVQAQEPNYLSAINLLKDQLQRRTVIQGLSQGGHPPTWLTFLSERTIGIPTAHAVGWLTIDLLNLARDIWEYVKMVITEKLKDVLIHKLVMQTINWIQGGGKPQFITNWKGFLTDTAKNEAGKMIDTIMPGLCTSFAPLVRVAVIPVDPNRDLDALPSCTIDRVVQNVQNFAQSFENGGWIAYGAAMQPSNNLIGSIIQVKMLADSEGEKQDEAAKKDAESSSGYLSSKVCVKYGDPIRGTTETGVETLERGPCVEWKNTTPGETLASAVKDSGAAPLLRIVNATDLAALVNALINAALTKLVKLGVSTVSKGLLGLNMAKQDAAGDACKGLTGKDLTDCQAGWQPVSCTPQPVNVPVQTTVTVNNPAGGTLTGTGSGNVSLPNGADCTGGTDLSEPGTSLPPESGCSDNCPVDCMCACADSLTDSEFCFADEVSTAYDAVRARCNAGEDVGLMIGSCWQLPPLSPEEEAAGTDVNGDKYRDTMLGELGKIGGITVGNTSEEIWVRGDCGQAVCRSADNRPSDYPPNKIRGYDYCVDPGVHDEAYKIAMSNRSATKKPNAICPGPWF